MDKSEDQLAGFSAENLSWEVNESLAVATLLIDRPDKLNAIAMQMRRDISRWFELIEGDERVRAVIVRGRGGRVFSAGGDIPEFLELSDKELTSLAYPLSAPERCSKPVIAAIDGHCYGGGLELALACDLRVATPDSRFGFPEVTLGAMPGSGGTQRAVRLMGLTNAKRMVLTGEPVEAEEALRMGLLSYVVDRYGFEDRVTELATRLARLSPMAVQFAKLALDSAWDASVSAGVHLEGKAMAVLTARDDFREGVAAWKEKRDPVFRDR